MSEPVEPDTSELLAGARRGEKSAAALDHPNIVSVYWVGCERGVHYYAMQYIEGRTLAQVIDELRASSPLPPGEGQGVRAVGGGQRAAGKGTEPTVSLGTSPQAAPPDDSPEPRTLSPEPSSPAARPSPLVPDTKREPQAAISTKGPNRTAEFFRSAVQLGIQAAEALEHAHQMGVVHRDIKPSNLMVEFPLPSPTGRGLGGEGRGPGGERQGARGECPHLWVTDFGLAMTQKDPALTMTGDIVGTLRYMSPEQALGKRSQMDHRTDIYSLGVTLYELLTLQPAFAGDNRETLVRRLLEDDPPRPRTVNRAIPRDLETIVLKATAKEPQQRYATAQELADDLKRFLADEPIRARRPSLADRAAKWARRHRPVVWSGAVGLAFALAVAVTSACLLLTAYEGERREHLAAVANASEATQNASKAQENAAKAEKNYEMARAAVRQMLTRVADESVARIPEMKEVRRRLLEDAITFYTELLKLSPRDARAHSELAQVHDMLAQYDKAIANCERAVSLEPQNPQFHAELAGFFLRCPDVVYRDAQRGLTHAKRAVEICPNEPRYHWMLARAYDVLGFKKEAVTESEKAGDSAGARYIVGDWRGALQELQKRVEASPSDAWNLYYLGELYSKLGEHEKALAALNKALEVHPTPMNPSVFYFYAMRGEVYARRKMYASALADLDKAVELGPFRSYTYKRRANVHFQLKNYEKALADIAKAVELKPDDFSNLTWLRPAEVASCPDERLRQGLLELADKTIELTKGAADAYVARAQLYAAFGQPEKALADFGKAIELEPKNPDVWAGRAHFSVEQAKWDPAIADLSGAVELKPEQTNLWYRRALVRVAAGRLDEYRKDCAAMLQRFGQSAKADDAHWVAWTCALLPDATKNWPKVLALAEKAAKSDAKSQSYLNTWGAALYRAGRFEGAVARLSEADALAKEPSEALKSSPAYTWFFLAMAHHRLGHGEEAKKWLDKAVAWTDKALREADQGTADLPWNRRLTLKLLREEAEALLKSGPAPQSPKPAAKEKENGGKPE